MQQWWKPNRADLDNPVPWLCAEAIAYLESLLSPIMTVLEHGSGGSTLWFAQRVKRVLAVENDPDWVAALAPRLPKNAKVISDVGLTKIERNWDLVLIDGEPVGDRCYWMREAPRFVKSGGYIVLDNANRNELAADRAWLMENATLLTSIDAGISQMTYAVTDFYQEGRPT